MMVAGLMIYLKQHYRDERRVGVKDSEKTLISGWCEWLALPEFNIREIEAKVDTGTETSVLHTSLIDPMRKQGALWLRFGISPLPERSDMRAIGFAPVKERRLIKDAEGNDEVCFVIETEVCLGALSQRIELALTSRDAAKFQMVLGRSALQSLNLLVDPNSRYVIGQPEEERISSAAN
jgi:hypothetical protein